MEMKYNEEDFCDLDSKKICDNCCRCIDNDKEYATINATFIPFDGYVEDNINVLNKSIKKIAIDEALLAEWEEKLKDI